MTVPPPPASSTRAGLLPEGYRYCAFISYSHADAAWARWLHHGLETYAIPANLIGRDAPVGTVPARLKPVFRDRDELPAAAELGPQLEAALRESVTLVVLCSPHSAKSRWVNEEVLFFKRLGRAARVFPLIVGGVPGGGEGRECFPPGVRVILNPDGTIAPQQLEPLAADAQPKKDGKALALLKIIAGITGLPLDELRQREQQRRQKRLAILASVGLVLASAMTVLAVIAWQQRQAAVANEHRARTSEDLAKTEAARATAAEAVAKTEATRATKAETVAVNEREAAQASERRALASEKIAKAEAERATKAEAVAVSAREATLREQEKTRRALADTQMSLAEAAFNAVELPAMVQALDSVPADLRSQRWNYLSARRDASLGDFPVPGIDRVTTIVAVPDQMGQFIVASMGNLARVEAYTGAVLMRSRAAIPPQPIIACSPDGSRLALTNKALGEIRFLHLADGVQEKTIPSPTRTAQRIVFSPDGAWLAVLDSRGVGELKTAKLWLVDARDGTVRWSRPMPAVDVGFSPDGRRLFTATVQPRKFLMLDAENGETLKSHDAYPSSLALSHDGQQLALGLYTGEVELISVATGDVVRSARLHAGMVEQVAWTARDHLLTVGFEGKFESRRRAMRLWDTKNFSPCGTFLGVPDGGVFEWTLEPQSGFLLVGGVNGASPRRWRITADLEAARITTAAEQGWGVGFLGDDVLVARRGYELGRYVVTDPRTPLSVGQPGPGGCVTVAVHEPSRLFALASRINDPAKPYQLHLFRRTAGEPELLREIALDQWSARLDFDPAGTRIVAVAMNNKPTLVLDVKSGERLVELPVCERAVFNAAGDRLVAIVPRKRTADDVEDDLTLFDAQSGQPVKTVTHRFRLNELVASPDRKLIAIGGADKIVRVLDAGTLEERWSFRAHDAEITALAFQPGQAALVSAANDGTAKLWDYETARLRATFYGFDGTPVMAAFSPGGRLLAVESQEHCTRLFDLKRFFEPPEPERPVAEIPRAAGDWQDLIAALNPADIARRGKGWRLNGSVLTLPAVTGEGITLRSNATGDASYQLRLKLRRLPGSGPDALLVRVPWGQRLVLFRLDGDNDGTYYTHLGQLQGRTGQNGPGVVMGKQVRDAAPHVLELTFRFADPNVRFAATLDGAPLCQWTGLLTSFGLPPPAGYPPGLIYLGTAGAGWEVFEAKLRRL